MVEEKKWNKFDTPSAPITRSPGPGDIEKHLKVDRIAVFCFFGFRCNAPGASFFDLSRVVDFPPLARREKLAGHSSVRCCSGSTAGVFLLADILSCDSTPCYAG
jgi:hypothetical protein